MLDLSRFPPMNYHDVLSTIKAWALPPVDLRWQATDQMTKGGGGMLTTY